jgi:DHA1 family bicyclomycin/chloramphenicol resistance-like MFS transporter
MSYTHARLFDRATPPHIVTLVLLAGVSAMNMSIFMSALPRMTVDFGTEYAIMQLSISLYLLFTAGMQIIIGPISDKFGRRPVVIVSLSVFGLASIGCYFSQTIETFLLFRMMQASVASGMVLSRAIVRDVVPQDQAASTIGYVTMGMSLVPMFAPTVGGFLDQWFGWRSIFIFLSLFGFALATLCWADQGETQKGGGLSFREQIQGYPELFTSLRFWGYAASAAFASGVFFAFLGGSPFVATEVFGLEPSTTKYLFGVPAIGYFVGNLITGRTAVRFGVNKMIIFGSASLCFGMALSLLLTSVGLGGPIAFFGCCLFVGLGNGMVLPNATAGLLSVRPHLAGTASGVGGALMIAGGAGLAALSGVLLENGNGSYPLQWVMLISAICGLASILFVIRREKRLAIA